MYSINIMKYYFLIKIESFVTIKVGLRTLIKICQIEKDKCHTISFIKTWNLNTQKLETEWCLSGLIRVGRVGQMFINENKISLRKSKFMRFIA